MVLPDHNQNGFTLIELMVTMTIMAGLLAIAVPAYNNFNATQKVRLSGDALVQNLKNTQNNATAGVVPTACPTSTANFKYDGWYMLVSPATTQGTYVMSASCTDSTATPNVTQAIGQSTTKEVLQPAIATTLKVNDTTAQANPVYIVFRPLTQNVQFFSGMPFTQANLMNITSLQIVYTLSGKTITTYITPAGQIYEK